jgi:thymidylate synthase
MGKIMSIRFDTFQQAYLHLIRDLIKDPEHVNAPRGHKSRERLSVSYSISDPVQRHLAIPRRRPNFVFNFAEALWYLSGSDELTPISYYAPSIANYSADGRVLNGTAYGKRIFRMGESRLDQWRQVRQVLKQDRDSKRAVIQVFEASELTDPANIDVACTLALQFLIRNEKLSLIAFMRANDCYRGMVSDVFSFTFLQELMARELHIEVGPYYHCAGSLHLYDTDFNSAHRISADEDGAASQLPILFGRMPAGNNWPNLETLFELERRLRLNLAPLSARDSEFCALPQYWQQVAMLFEAYRAVVYQDGTNESLLAALWPLYRYALSWRWPDRFSGLAWSAADPHSVPHLDPMKG